MLREEDLFFAAILSVVELRLDADLDLLLRGYVDLLLLRNAHFLVEMLLSFALPIHCFCKSLAQILGVRVFCLRDFLQNLYRLHVLLWQLPFCLHLLMI